MLYSDFTFWLLQQPKDIQFLWYLGMLIIFIICVIYGMLQKPKEE